MLSLALVILPSVKSLLRDFSFSGSRSLRRHVAAHQSVAGKLIRYALIVSRRAPLGPRIVDRLGPARIDLFAKQLRVRFCRVLL